MKGIKDGIDAFVVNDGEDGAVHRGPGVTAVMGFTRSATAPLHLWEEAETAATMMVEKRLNALFIGLVVGNEDSFHYGLKIEDYFFAALICFSLFSFQ